MNDADPQCEWRALTSANDIEELMRLFGDFHDGCVHEIHAVTGHYVHDNLSMSVGWETTVRLLIQRQFSDPSAIELRFDEVVGFRLSPPAPNYDAIIYGAAFFIRDGIYYWADNAGWKPEFPERGDTTWVSARKVSWRDASNWMGPDLRYLTADD
jgi:hypothetical protein